MAPRLAATALSCCAPSRCASRQGFSNSCHRSMRCKNLWRTQGGGPLSPRTGATACYDLHAEMKSNHMQPNKFEEQVFFATVRVVSIGGDNSASIGTGFLVKHKVTEERDVILAVSN